MTLSNDYETSVCLEGNAGSGKTTCCVELAKARGSVLLREYTETLDAAHREFLKSSFERRADDDEFAIWRCAEERRAEACAAASSMRVVLDTSLVSVVAFGLARRKFNQSGDLSATIRGYQDLLSRGRLVIPGKFVHLRLSEEVRQARLKKRGNCHPFLAQPDVSQYLDKLRADFFDRYLPRTCWTSIDTSTLTPTETTEQVDAALVTLEAKPTADAFTAWLADLPAP